MPGGLEGPGASTALNGIGALSVADADVVTRSVATLKELSASDYGAKATTTGT